MLSQRTNIRCLKRTVKPNMTAKQAELARPKCGRLFIKNRNVDFILDDESYFTLSNTTLANDRFYSDDLQNTPYDVKNKMKAKYEPKLLVWVAGSPRGVSNIYKILTVSGGHCSDKPFFHSHSESVYQRVNKNSSRTLGKSDK